MKLSFKLNLFLKEFLLFAPTLFLGVFSAASHRPFIEKTIVEPPSSFSWDSIIIVLAFISIFFLLSSRFKKFGRVGLKFFLLLVVFSGSQIIASSLVASPWDLVIALGVAIMFMLFNNVFIHDLGIIIGIAGVSSILGITISPIVAVGLLVIMSFYDILAVYWTKHMVYMAKNMIESGAIFGFVIPFNFRDFFYHKNEARKLAGEKFMILGSGDVGLPLILASSVAVASLSQALIVVAFALLGLFLTHIIFVNQSGRSPMAALPPIATLTIVGYLVSQLF